MSLEGLKTFVDGVVDWYWMYNSQRNPIYSLPPSWLDRLYNCKKIITDLTMTGDRPTVGVWGPSQAGKSSLLTTNLDLSNDDIQGVNSALTWDPEHPCRFRGTAKTENVRDPDTGMERTEVVEETNVTLNPYHAGADATGCVTRYVLKDELVENEYPVEIRLVSRKALIHAIAAGYLTECVRTTDEGNIRFLDEDDINKILTREDDYGNDRRSLLSEINENEVAPETLRENYEWLRDICNVVEQLIKTHDPRYVNITWKWDILKTRILNERCLRYSFTNLKKFMYWLLWENKTKLNELFEALDNFLEDLEARYANRRFFCTLEVASVLIDIAAYAWLNDSHVADENQLNVERTIIRTRTIIHGLKYREEGADIFIFSGDGAGVALFRQPERDFGFFQACVLELTVPIHLDERMSDQFKRFITQADFLDFPGVAQQTAELNDGDLKINCDTLPEDKRYRLLTQLMKRGRTASIIYSYADLGEIDTFVLTVRSATHIHNSSQLINGIRQWWKYVDPKYEGKGRPPLPLFLALTFSAAIVNMVTAAHGQLPDGGFAPCFEWLEQLDELSRHDVARLLLTTYKNRNLPGGDILDYNMYPIRTPDNPELIAAKAAISNDKMFRLLFGTPGTLRYETFNQMCDSTDGGVNFLFEQVTEAVDMGRKQNAKEKKYNEVIEELKQLIIEALPSGDQREADQQRQQFLTNFKISINAAMESPLSPTARKLGFATQMAWVSYLIRNLQSVNSEQIYAQMSGWPEALPGALNQTNITNLINSLANQFLDRFQDVQINWYQEIGLANPTEIQKLFQYFVGRRLNPLRGRDYFIPECIYKWCRSYCIAELPMEVIAHELAVVIENVIWHGFEPMLEDIVIGNVQTQGIGFRRCTDYTVLDVNEAIHAIENMNAIGNILEDDNAVNDPHKTAVINPFMELIDRVANGSVENERGEQPGDPELVTLVNSCRDIT